MTQSMSERSEPHAAPSVCPTCQATLSTGMVRCWLCGGDLRSAGAGEMNVTVPVPAERRAPAGGFSLASLMMFVTLLCVIFGVSTINYGVGIPVGMLLLVVWWRTAAVSRRRSALGRTLTRSEQMHMFLSSLGLAIALLMMVAVGICVAFCSACFGVFAAADGMSMWRGEKIGLMAVCIVSFVAALGLLWLARKWDRYSWQRDIGKKN